MIAVAAVVLLIGGVALAISPKTFGLNQGLNNASSGRAGLVTGGTDLFADRPGVGLGLRLVRKEYRRHHPGSSQTLSASHTIPVTIAAEQGLIGELVYIALVLVAAVTLLRGARGSPYRVAIAAAFVALVFHTMLYADFLEDPVTWTLLGVGAALAVGARAEARERSRRRAGRSSSRLTRRHAPTTPPAASSAETSRPSCAAIAPGRSPEPRREVGDRGLERRQVDQQQPLERRRRRRPRRPGRPRSGCRGCAAPRS